MEGTLFHQAARKKTDLMPPCGSSELYKDHHHDQHAGLTQSDPRGFDGFVGPAAGGEAVVHRFGCWRFGDAKLRSSAPGSVRRRVSGGVHRASGRTRRRGAITFRGSSHRAHSLAVRKRKSLRSGRLIVRKCRLVRIGRSSSSAAGSILGRWSLLRVPGSGCVSFSWVGVFVVVRCLCCECWKARSAGEP